MRDTLVLWGQGTAETTYFYTGFCPALVEVRSMTTEEDVTFWTPMILEESGIEINADDGAYNLGTNGIRLVKFDDEPGTVPGSGGTPTNLENGEWYKANGIKIHASCPAIVNAYPYCVIVHRMTVPIVRAVHDGGDAVHTYFEDSSMDFKEAGISSNGRFILINVTVNDDYAYVGKITKPAGKSKYCRIYTYEDEGLATATAAADFDDDDIVYIIPRRFVQHPLSGIGLMT